MALTTVVLLAAGTLAFSITTAVAAGEFTDSVYRRELRIQARLNADACLSFISIKFSKNYFLNGKVQIPELGCQADVTNSFDGSIMAHIKTTLEGVNVIVSGSFSL